MELVTHGLTMVLMVTASLAVCMGGLIAAHARLYNVRIDAARRRQACFSAWGRGK